MAKGSGYGKGTVPPKTVSHVGKMGGKKGK
jgi:hypothetical protein